MVWLIAGLPASAVVAGIATFMIAAHKPDSLVSEQHVKQGMAVVSTASTLEEQAARLMIAAEISSQAGRLAVTLSGRLEKLPDTLTMTVVHPTHADQDMRLKLAKSGPGIYVTELPEPLAGKRRIVLEPEDLAWRLAGEAQPTATGSWRIVADSPPSTTHPQGRN
jgi:hypothetical protein